MLPPGVAPHWLPYVEVDDADAAAARARKNGGTVMMGPEDIPTIGRFAVIQDPTGGVLAVMKSQTPSKA
jgi:predicted enzyme related to lactoylglutathione lyase